MVKRHLNINTVETFMVKATDILKETEKAFLFRTHEGDCWIPFSCVQSIDIHIGKKRPYRIKVIKSFTVKYTEDPNKQFLEELKQKTNFSN